MNLTNRSLKYRLGNIRKRALAASGRPDPANVRAYLNGTTMPSSPPEEGFDDSQDRRRFNRVPLKSEVSMRRIGGFNFQVALSNVSSGGCNVELIEEAEAGDSAIARFPQLEPLGSRICWTNGRTTGLEFLTAIHPAVFDLLISRLPARESVPNKETV